MNLYKNMLCLSRQLGFLFIVLMFSYNTSQAACTYLEGSDVTFTQATAFSGGSQYYYLYDCDGNFVAGPITDPAVGFSDPGYGCYEIYGVNSCPGSAPATLIAGSTTADITALAAADYDSTTGLQVTVCNTSDLTGCELYPDDITVVSEPDYNTSGTQMYVLVCDGNVVSTSMGGPSASFMIPDDGDDATAPSCEVHAINYCPPGDASAIIAGASWAAVDPSADPNFDVASAVLNIPCTIPLPLELISFDASCDKDKVDLKWVTASEENVKHIVVEHSIDGDRYKAIATIEAIGNNTPTQNTYTYVDKSPSSVNYYRLKIVDMDGSFEYSQVKSTKCLKGDFGFSEIFPNPTKGGITINFEVSSTTAPVTIKLVDVLGRVMDLQIVDPVEGLNTAHLDLTKLASAMYVVMLDDGTNRVTERIMKK